MKVGICAIIKDCKPVYLKEWVDWHTLIGVDYFFIYDNESQIPISETLQSYPNVFVKLWEGKVQQTAAYNHCIYEQKHSLKPVCDWVAFIDDDEFIVLEKGETIQEFLKDKKSSGVVLNWCTFGAEEENKSVSQIDRYTKCVPLTHSQNKYVKSIVQPKTVLKFNDPHFPVYVKGNGVDIKGNVVRGSTINKPYRQIAWINHYYCRSLEDYHEKIKRGLAHPIIEGKVYKTTYDMSYFNLTNDYATDTNTTIIELKKQYMGVKKKLSVMEMRPEKVAVFLKQLITYISINIKLHEAKMVEIGSFTGESTVIFAEKFGRVIAIDPFVFYTEKYGDRVLDSYGQELWDNIEERFKERIIPYGNITHLKMYSDDACKEIKEQVDFVYIDGLHTYEQCKKDIENYLPLVRKGGYIGGHDYSNAWPGVKKAVNEMFGKPDHVFGGDGNWVVRVR
jgi:predicted O-methyltransferase YrrM